MISRFFNWLGEQIMDMIWAFFIILTIAAFFVPDARSAEFLGSEVQGWIGAEAVTDGRDAVQLGLTFEWKYVEFDIIFSGQP